jgi:hypothetical protein
MLVSVDGHTVQLDRRPATIHADHGLVSMEGNVLHILHVVERMTRDKQVILAGDEVLKEMLTVVLEEVEEVVAAAAAVTAAADHGVMARTAALRVGRAVPAGSAGGPSTDQRHMAADHYFPGRLAGRLDDFQLAAEDRGLAERTRYRGGPLLDNVVVTSTSDVDRVMTGDAMLGDCAAIAEGKRVVAAPDDYFAASGDVDLIGTVAGDYGAAAENGYVRLPATSNTDCSGH